MLTGLQRISNYTTLLRQVLVNVEETRVVKRKAYFDSRDPVNALVTIGIGFNIDTVSKNLRYVLEEMGVYNLPSEIDPTKTAQEVIKEAIDSVVTTFDPDLQSALDNALQQHFSVALGATAEFAITEPQAYNILDKIINDKKYGLNGERSLDDRLRANGIDVAALEGTKEYLVLT